MGTATTDHRRRTTDHRPPEDDGSTLEPAYGCWGEVFRCEVRRRVHILAGNFQILGPALSIQDTRERL